jgi:hypothetical protein
MASVGVGTMRAPLAAVSGNRLQRRAGQAGYAQVTRPDRVRMVSAPLARRPLDKDRRDQLRQFIDRHPRGRPVWLAHLAAWRSADHRRPALDQDGRVRRRAQRDHQAVSRRRGQPPERPAELRDHRDHAAPARTGHQRHHPQSGDGIRPPDAPDGVRSPSAPAKHRSGSRIRAPTIVSCSIRCDFPGRWSKP